MTSIQDNPMTSIQDMIDAIRADSIVGTGSCSTIDECYTDAELAQVLNLAGRRRTTDGAVRAARAMHRLFEDVAEDIRKS